MNSSPNRNTVPLLARQLAACAMFGSLLMAIIAALYIQNRQREWVLRREQAQHRLDKTFDRISNEVGRVQSDATYLANRSAVRRFVLGEDASRAALESDFSLFVENKGLYDQLRLLDLDGNETIRVNLDGATPGA